KKFQAFESKLYEGSLRRAEDIIFKLNALGVEITMEEVALQKFNPLTPIHGMHIARVMVEKGYVTKPDKFFKKYVAYGKPAYSYRARPTPEEACEAITSAGGIAVVAHPARIKMTQAELREKITRLKDCGLCGIEARYTTHTNEQTAYYEELAGSLGLLITGGSDTHGLDGNRVIGTPRFEPCKELLKRLKID
ncbi:MAG: phosphoesterase, partial [Clostridia bacterium]|nr:phosphoesterase [Clostridia bacterium]